MPVSRNFSFLRRPRWLVAHLVALTAIVVFASLGMWQLRRHDERGELNTRIEARSAAAPAELSGLLDRTGDVTELEYRQVTLQGEYRTGDEVILQARSLDGVSGHHVLTPVALSNGTAVIVDRGWVPIDVAGPPVPEAAPPSGPVTISGLVRLSQQRGSFGPTDPPTGTLERVSRVDIDRLQQQTSLQLLPVFVDLSEQTPAQAGLPRILPPPETDAGPHLSYAVQWFVFAGVVLISYPVLMVRTASGSRRRSRPDR
jgi:surfeit locus 1 family protein